MNIQSEGVACDSSVNATADVYADEIIHTKSMREERSADSTSKDFVFVSFENSKLKEPLDKSLVAS